MGKNNLCILSTNILSPFLRGVVDLTLFKSSSYALDQYIGLQLCSGETG